jgi:hypothetical protein
MENTPEIFPSLAKAVAKQSRLNGLAAGPYMLRNLVSGFERMDWR